MPAYMIFIREEVVRDAAAMERYRSSNRDQPLDPKLKPLVVYGELETLEGQPADGVVMLQFPTIEDAKAWYHSPAYQSAIPHRQQAANYRVLIVQGL